MTDTIPRIHFRAYSQNVPPNIPPAIQSATRRLLANRAAAAAQVADWESLRHQAHDLRLDGIMHLDSYLAELRSKVVENGGHFHLARDSEHACQIVTQIALDHQVRTVVKGKSMASEEIDLNAALARAGVRAVETDVGEFIIQMAGIRPSHILGPAAHMSKEEIAALFSDKLGIDAPADARQLTDIAREKLRGEFLQAEMGITGANFVIAETGTVVLVTNEGNGRLCTTLPPLYVAVAGIDKVVPRWDDATILLRLLARSATGQKMSCYTSLMTGLCLSPDEMGPREFHLVLVDNGRSRIAQDPVVRETLLCIRCAACLNICPVYNQVGGHAYGWVYSGPMGAILAPQLLGTTVARELPYASSLCGACADVCPVKIPIPQILLHLRRRIAQGDDRVGPTAPASLRVATKLAATGMSTPWLYRLAARALGIAQTPFRQGSWLPKLPSPLDRWTDVRPMRALQGRFRGWWREHARNQPADGEQTLESRGEASGWGSLDASPLPTSPHPSPDQGEGDGGMDQFLGEVNRLAGRARRIDEGEIDDALCRLVRDESIRQAILWGTDGLVRLHVEQCLEGLGVKIIPSDADKSLLAQADLGVTEADYAIAESGTLGLLSSPVKSPVTSLLPRIHLALVRPEAVRSDLGTVLAQAKGQSYLVFVTGPSRTSDIESTPTLGAHGPKSLYVWALT